MARTPFLLALAVVALSAPALADPPVRVAAAPSAATAPAPNATAAGLVVVALPGATDAAWPLARGVYGAPSLRPSSIDEAHARVLCGEAPAPDAPADMRDLAADVASVHGDDAPSRALLADVARRMAARGVVVVSPGPQPTARVFLTESGAFDAATYSPDPSTATAWSGAVASLTRVFGNAPATVSPPAPAGAAIVAQPLPRIATHDGPTIDNEPPHHRRFYESGWFWGAIGAALFAGGAVYFATRDNGPETIHLQVQVPH